MVNRKISTYRCIVLVFLALGVVFCWLPSGAYAGGVHFGFGVDVPIGGRVVAPPVEVYSPPVVVEREPARRVVIEREPPRRVVIEQPPQRIVVEPAPPRVVYEEPVVVERRTSVTTYYHPAPRYREYREETERQYYERRGAFRTDDNDY